MELNISLALYTTFSQLKIVRVVNFNENDESKYQQLIDHWNDNREESIPILDTAYEGEMIKNQNQMIIVWE